VERHTQTHKPSTVTLAAHARRGLMIVADICSKFLLSVHHYCLSLVQPEHYIPTKGKNNLGICLFGCGFSLVSCPDHTCGRGTRL